MAPPREPHCFLTTIYGERPTLPASMDGLSVDERVRSLLELSMSLVCPELMAWHRCETRTAPKLELGAVSGDELLRASFVAVLLELRAAYGPRHGFWLFPMTPTHLSAAEVDELWREAVAAVPGARLVRRSDRWIAVVDERALGTAA